MIRDDGVGFDYSGNHIYEQWLSEIFLYSDFHRVLFIDLMTMPYSFDPAAGDIMLRFCTLHPVVHAGELFPPEMSAGFPGIRWI